MIGLFSRAGSMPWRDASWCSLDLELTGLDPRHDAIISIGAVPIEDGRIVLAKSLYTLVRSSKRSGHGAMITHKLRVDDLQTAPTIDVAFELVLDALSGRVPVFHSAAVERAFLGPLFRSRRQRLPRAADTEALGRLWLRSRDGVAPAGLPLARLAAELGQPGETPHHALGDALTTAKAFITLASHLDSEHPQTIRSLLRAEDLLRGAARFG